MRKETPHDPDTVTLEKASNADLKTMKIVEGSTIAFILESSLILVGVTEKGSETCREFPHDYNRES